MAWLFLVSLLVCLISDLEAQRGGGRHGGGGGGGHRGGGGGGQVRAANDYLRAHCPDVTACKPATHTGPNPDMPCPDWKAYNTCYRKTVEGCTDVYGNNMGESSEFDIALGKKRENCWNQCSYELTEDECNGIEVEVTTSTTATTTSITTTTTSTTATTTSTTTTTTTTTTSTSTTTTTTTTITTTTTSTTTTSARITTENSLIDQNDVPTLPTFSGEDAGIIPDIGSSNMFGTGSETVDGTSSDSETIDETGTTTGSATVFETGSSSSTIAGTGTGSSTIAKTGTDSSTIAGTGTGSSTIAGTGTDSSTIAKTGTDSSTIAKTGTDSSTIAGTGTDSSTIGGTGNGLRDTHPATDFYSDDATTINNGEENGSDVNGPSGNDGTGNGVGSVDNDESDDEDENEEEDEDENEEDDDDTTRGFSLSDLLRGSAVDVRGSLLIAILIPVLTLCYM